MRTCLLAICLLGCATASAARPPNGAAVVVAQPPPVPARWLEESRSPPPRSCADLYARVQPLLTARRISEAREALVDARAWVPDCVIADLLEARVARLRGDAPAAFAALDRAALSADAELVRADRIATALLSEGEAGARHALLFCDDPPPLDAASRTGCAVAALRLGDRWQAEVWLLEAIGSEPRSFAAWMDVGEMALDVHEYEAARGAFAQAAWLAPDAYVAQLGLGAAARGVQDVEAADAAFRRALAIDPDGAEAYYDLGLLYQDHRDGSEPVLRQAQEFYRQFVARAGDRFTAEVDEVMHHCPVVCPRPPRERGTRRHARQCQPGRIEQIDSNCGPIRELAQMQADIAAMQRQLEAERPPSASEPARTTPP